MDNTQNAVAIFDKCALAYQDKFMSLPLYHQGFDLFCNSIAKENALVLDIACGPGNITQYLIKKRSDFKILGIDLSSNMIDLARLNNPTAEFQLMDCRHLSSLHQQYDAIMCGFCLPYLSAQEAIQLIINAAGLLTAKGVIYISTMEADDKNTSGIKKTSAGNEIYIHYHKADYLTDALVNNGFKIIAHQRIDYPNSENKEATDLVIIANK
jgi:2-polyprenyl-3-methyl-5-hydroxy-6-metoxy-1,4-benzoquinol methylase